MVLFISANKKEAVAAANLFKKLQIVSYGTTPQKALAEISPLYHATVLINPEEFADCDDFIERILTYYRGMPIFALTDRPEKLKHPELFMSIESNDIRSASFACKIMDLAEKHGLPTIGLYRVGHLESVCDRAYMTYYGIRIDFSKTESLVLRYLMATAPFPQAPATILKYAFPPAKRPEAATIRTHISTMNKKFTALFPSMDFVIHVPGKGYKIKFGEET